MVELGSCDPTVDDAACDAYLKNAKQMMIGATLPNFSTQLRGEGVWKPLTKLSGEPMSVREIQRFLKSAGFFPFGKDDGICGYRTTAAIRLFQEYLRTVEGRSDFTPDGRWGPKSTEQARRWQAEGKTADEWTRHSAAHPSPECAAWLALLGAVKAKYQTNPTRMLNLVDANTKPTDTVKVGKWDFDPKKIHFIGVRRRETVQKAQQSFDDVFVLLVNGLAFKFFGSTEPGATKDPRGFPFLVAGQHTYRFGWHNMTDGVKVFQALKPAGPGVLVVRSKDLSLTEEDLPAQLECNPSINVHWGGEGDGIVGTWSAGCQVMVGRAYIDHQDRLQACAHFAAPGYAALNTQINGVLQTKGAYTLLADLATALSGATPSDSIVHYTLIYEADLALNQEAADKAASALTRFKAPS